MRKGPWCWSQSWALITLISKFAPTSTKNLTTRWPAIAWCNGVDHQTIVSWALLVPSSTRKRTMLRWPFCAAVCSCVCHVFQRMAGLCWPRCLRESKQCRSGQRVGCEMQWRHPRIAWLIRVRADCNRRTMSTHDRWMQRLHFGLQFSSLQLWPFISYKYL